MGPSEEWAREALEAAQAMKAAGRLGEAESALNECRRHSAIDALSRKQTLLNLKRLFGGFAPAEPVLRKLELSYEDAQSADDVLRGAELLRGR